MFEPHSEKQDKAIFSNYDITAVVTGIQWGKTTVGAYWLWRMCMTYTNPRDNFIITAPTYKILNQSTLPAFLDVFKGLGEYRKVDQEFKISGGGTIYLRTGTEPDSIIGITNVRAIWCDESGKYSLYFWQNIEGRAAFANGKIILTTTPYTLNWMFRELVKPVKEGKRDDVLLVGAKSIDNPYFNRKTYDKRKQTMDPRKFKSMYEGQFEKMQGLVYDCFEDRNNIVDDFKFPAGTKLYGGIDWGYTDPFVFVIRAVTIEGVHFQISEYYKTGLTISDILKVLKSKMALFDIKQIFCDPSRPDYIEELNRHHIPACKANNDINIGIDTHYELIKTGKYKILKDSSPHTIDEMENYHWPEPKDLGPDEHAKMEKPVDQSNHSMDANRYITLGTRFVHTRKQPFVPGDEKEHKDHRTVIREVKKRKPIRHEAWS